VAGEKEKIHHNLKQQQMEITERLTCNAQVKQQSLGKNLFFQSHRTRATKPKTAMK